MQLGNANMERNTGKCVTADAHAVAWGLFVKRVHYFDFDLLTTHTSAKTLLFTFLLLRVLASLVRTLQLAEATTRPMQ